MKISKTTAQNIVNRAMKVIGKSVNVMDERGMIIASGNAGRLGSATPARSWRCVTGKNGGNRPRAGRAMAL